MSQWQQPLFVFLVFPFRQPQAVSDFVLGPFSNAVVRMSEELLGSLRSFPKLACAIAPPSLTGVTAAEEVAKHLIVVVFAKNGVDRLRNDGSTCFIEVRRR